LRREFWKRVQKGIKEFETYSNKRLRRDSLRLGDRLNKDSERLRYGFVHSKP
jgi:hypothetical protein